MFRKIFVKQIKEAGCTCDRLRSERPSVLVEVAAEVHNRMLPCGFQCVQLLQPGEEQKQLDFANYFRIKYDEDNSWPLRILRTDEVTLLFNWECKLQELHLWG